MRDFSQTILGIALIAALTACASGRQASQPILARAGGTLPVEDATADGDLHACRAEAQKSAPANLQPRWLPPLGPTETGAVLGTVDPHAARPSREAYRTAIERCLAVRGYIVRGWQ